jgi:hypothetical protein
MQNIGRFLFGGKMNHGDTEARREEDREEKEI